MAITSSSYQLSASPVTIFAQLLVIVVTILVLVWLLHFREGLAFKSVNKQKILNMHILLMTLGPVLAAGEAIMAYQIVHGRKRSQKAVHLLLHFVAIVVGVLGTYVIFNFHNEIGLWNMFSLHSWLGIITICALGLQWLVGFFTYWFPGAEKSTKATPKPWHIFAGMVIFLIGISTVEIGLGQIAYYLGRSREALIVNFTGLLIFLFAVCVSLSVVLPQVD